jgi:hypothetical protein
VPRARRPSFRWLFRCADSSQPAHAREYPGGMGKVPPGCALPLRHAS